MSNDKFIPVNRPIITFRDRRKVAFALKKAQLSGSADIVQDFEKEFSARFGVKYTVTVNSGSAAIDIAVESLQINRADEVIVPTLTIISSINELIRKRAKVKFIDCSLKDFNLSEREVINSISKKTKLVMLVHIYGRLQKFHELSKISHDRGFSIIEDAAQALNVRNSDKYAGTQADIGIYSFYPNKLITGGEGGAIVTNNLEIASRAKLLRNLCFGNERFVSDSIGWNSRWNSLSAALALSQLKNADKRTERKRQIFALYLEGLMGHSWFHLPDLDSTTKEFGMWVFPLVLRREIPLDAKQLQSYLLDQGIETRRFFCPLHLQKAVISNLSFELTSSMQNSELLWNKGLYLPSGLGNTNDEIFKVITCLQNIESHFLKLKKYQ